ncbi:MAG: hypothetical protein CSA55_00435 [Ilumatobacter coccineus]|uniref:Uncharacterized protein n=1 Tax=Ilumatobacter coccineus TaxID=467094 RepID=A0A2G6KG45_9ACTN|nr:MAG: hypothetical protein CSA55_00435 [Ilumatobacter coccineus]
MISSLRPSAIIRRRAGENGLLGPSTFWSLVTVGLWVHRFLSKKGKGVPEVVDVSKLGAGRNLEITTISPMTRRRRRALAKEGIRVPSLNEHRVLAQIWADRKVAQR